MPKQVRDPDIERLSSTEDVQAALVILKKNMETLIKYFDTNGQLNGFRHLEFQVQAGETNLRIKHGLGFVPKDVLITRLLAPSGVKLTLQHDDFDRDDIVVSASAGSGAVKVRMFVGTYRGSSGETEVFTSGVTNQEFKALL